MSLLPNWTTWQFAAAGLACAAGPILIHLLNRRRYRVVAWGAMHLLRQALEHQRRLLRLRDLWLLLVRTSCVLIFGAALARPYWSPQVQGENTAQPVHAVVVIDNSMSMAYHADGQTSLARAVARAKEWLATLPLGSRFSILPLCGQAPGGGQFPVDSVRLAGEALQRIAVADTSANLATATQLAKAAAQRIPDITPQIVCFTDLQQSVWPGTVEQRAEFNGRGMGRGPVTGGTVADQVPPAPTFNVVDVGADAADQENSWVAEFSLADELADVGAPTSFFVRLRHQGAAMRRNVQVKLTVDGVDVASLVTDIPTGLTGTVLQFPFQFDKVAANPHEPAFSEATVAITTDRLPLDDAQHLVIPVVSHHPILFVDQFGADDEDLARGRVGETYTLRRLLNSVLPMGRNPSADMPQHVRMDQLNREHLQNVRVAVVAGVPDPAEHVDQLREFVSQGGGLLVAAGGAFDPLAWNASAWRDGGGLLPFPLLSEPIGSLPPPITAAAAPTSLEVGASDDHHGSPAALQPFFLSFESLRNQPLFRLPDVSDDDLRDLYTEPLFFQAVQVDTRAQGTAPAEPDSAAARPLDETVNAAPRWLTWGAGVESLTVGEASGPSPAAPDAGVARAADPQTLARFDNGLPFLLQQRVGEGQVVLLTTSISSSWNTLPKSAAVLILDRIMRTLMRNTIPRRNVFPASRLAIPLTDFDAASGLELERPGAPNDADVSREMVEPGFLSARRQGVVIENVFRRGFYRLKIAAQKAPGAGNATHSARPPLVTWAVPAVGNNLDQALESDLTKVPDLRPGQSLAGMPLRRFGRHDDLPVLETTSGSRHIWQALLLSVLGLLILEGWMVVRPEWRASRLAKERVAP